MAGVTETDDDAGAQGVEHLQAAARELLLAARSFLNVVEEVVEDRDRLAGAAAGVTDLLRGAVSTTLRSSAPLEPWERAAWQQPSPAPASDDTAPADTHIAPGDGDGDTAPADGHTGPADGDTDPTEHAGPGGSGGSGDSGGHDGSAPPPAPPPAPPRTRPPTRRVRRIAVD